jgi:hypothetical protein
MCVQKKEDLTEPALLEMSAYVFTHEARGRLKAKCKRGAIWSPESTWPNLFLGVVRRTEDDSHLT